MCSLLTESAFSFPNTVKVGFMMLSTRAAQLGLCFLGHCPPPLPKRKKSSQPFSFSAVAAWLPLPYVGGDENLGPERGRGSLETLATAAARPVDEVVAVWEPAGCMFNPLWAIYRLPARQPCFRHG